MSQPNVAPAHKVKKVLVIDDDPVVTAVLQDRIEALGYTAVVRNQAMRSAQVIIAENPDVVILDINMPTLKGDFLAHLIRENASWLHIGVILHSSMRSEDLQRLVQETGALGFIPKTGDDHAFNQEFTRLVEKLNARRRG